jgi:hypothetical protein
MPAGCAMRVALYCLGLRISAGKFFYGRRLPAACCLLLSVVACRRLLRTLM